MKTINPQSGWTILGIIGVIISGGVGAIAFDLLFKVAGYSNSIPWALVPLFATPLTLSVQLLYKFFDLKELEGISREEKRRLKSMIDGKTRQLYIAIGYYTFSAALTVILLFFFHSNTYLFENSIRIIGLLTGISLFSILLIINESREISDFKSKIHDRSESKKKQKSALKRLKADDLDDITKNKSDNIESEIECKSSEFDEKKVGIKQELKRGARITKRRLPSIH
ncbi:MAG: hypothetical protein WBI40_09430 [Methylococcaceae bacterium]